MTWHTFAFLKESSPPAMTHYILVILLWCYVSPSVGRIFYVSSSLGNDARSLTEAQNDATPWKSISQVNSVMSQLLPGDSVLFCRGDVFYDKVCRIWWCNSQTPKLQISKSGNSTHSIVFDAYVCNTANQNRLPIISGGVSLSNAQWQPYNNGEVIIPCYLVKYKLFYRYFLPTFLLWLTRVLCNTCT